MASKWKYANLSAESRLQMLRNGNKKVFDEEVARTKDITKARKELGLDTTAQEKWIDEVGYNYSLSSAAPGDKVSKSGYSKLYLDGDGKKSTAKAKSVAAPSTTYITDAKYKIQSANKLAKKAAVQKYDGLKQAAKEELYSLNPYLEEALINSGASLNGGKAAKAYAAIENRLEDIYAEYDDELAKELNSLDKKYAAMTDKLIEYRKSGTAKKSLGTIANVLVKNAAVEDGYSAADVPGVMGRVSVKKVDGTKSGGVNLQTEKTAGKNFDNANATSSFKNKASVQAAAGSKSNNRTLAKNADGAKSEFGKSEFSDFFSGLLKKLSELDGDSVSALIEALAKRQGN